MYSLVRMALRISEYGSWTQEIKDELKPIQERVRKRKGQSTLSKAFCWSKDRMVAGVPDSEEKSTRSRRKATFSTMKQTGMPQAWSGPMT